VQADEHSAAPTNGFYGGVSLRDRATEGAGINFGPAASVWNRYAAPTADDTSSRALVFGGYRWRNDLAVEAAFSSLDRYALRPTDAGGVRQGVGLSIPASAGISDLQTHGWNVDVFTSWTFYKAFALYGRLGYAQADTAPLFGSAASVAPDIRRLRDGVNYGLGVRYDMNSALGLRLEYGRFGRFVGEIGSTLPETDQVTFGVQFRF
jgi:opacity protein-like surface antigen